MSVKVLQWLGCYSS